MIMESMDDRGIHRECETNTNARAHIKLRHLFLGMLEWRSPELVGDAVDLVRQTVHMRITTQYNGQ